MDEKYFLNATSIEKRKKNFIWLATKHCTRNTTNPLRLDIEIFA
jgi:hypothetical protein